MSKRIKRTYTFADGHTENLTHKQSWDGLRERGARSWKRIGRFAVVLFARDIAVAEEYDDELKPFPIKDCKDRVGQCDEVMRHLINLQSSLECQADIFNELWDAIERELAAYDLDTACEWERVEATREQVENDDSLIWMGTKTYRRK